MKTIVSLPLLLCFLLLCGTTKSSAQSSNIVDILEKAGDFSNFLRVIKLSHMASQITTQLQTSSDGLTVLAPTDDAFSYLKTGALNSLTNKQQVQLVQFHVIPMYLSKSLFQTVSNPLKTLADGTDDGKFPLNITISSDDVKLSTGIDEATVGRSLHSDGKLAVYEVNRVLLPPSIFLPPSPAPEPPKKEAPATPDDVKSLAPENGGIRGMVMGIIGMAVVCVSISFT